MRDLAEAKQVYGDAFGWAFNEYGPAYAGIVRPGVESEMGGLTVGEAGGGGPLVVIHPDDLEATLSAVTDAGCTVVTPPFEFPGGRRFQFADPSGNELAGWTPA